jgi:hypothetical protein
MRHLFLVLAACACSFADTLVTSVTCDGVTYNGSGSASCNSSDANASAEAFSATLSVNTNVSTDDFLGTSSAQAGLYGTYLLTVTGGSGDGFADPQLSTELELGDNSVFQNYASASLTNSSGGCEVTDGDGNPYQNNCTPTSVPFVFGTSQALYLSVFADTQIQVSDIRLYDQASAADAGFVFYGVNGQVLNDVTYTFVPAPEPSTLPLSAAMACAAFIARKRLPRPGSAARPYRSRGLAPAVCGKYRSRYARFR